MSEINILKIGNINLPRKESRSVDNFSFASIPGTGSAAGFVFLPDSSESNILDWSIELRFVNGSNESIIVDQVGCKFLGEKGYISKSRNYVRISDNQNLPLLIPANSEKVFKFDFSLIVYKKAFLFFLKQANFKEHEIVAPQTYQDLIKRVLIFVKIHNYQKPLTLEF